MRRFQIIENIISLEDLSINESIRNEISVTKFVFQRSTIAQKANYILLSDANQDEKRLSSFGDWTPNICEIGCYMSHGVRLTGSGFIFKGERLLDVPDLIANYVRADIETGRNGDLRPNLKLRSVFEPSLILSTSSYDVYGHFLLDILPRMWLFRACFGYMSQKKL